MATPQPMRRGPSQQQHAGATPAASTPYSQQLHASFSPHGPRSSPQQLKKSPANGGNSQSALPMNYDSPSANAFGAVLGIGGYDHNMGMGQLGGLRRNDDEEREKRLQMVISILKQKKGIVSEEALERLTKETGLDHMWDEGMGVGVRTRTLVIAGRALSLDIEMLNHIVQSVTLAFPESGPFVTQYAPKAEQILLHDLKLLPNEHPLTKKLDNFAANLERLAILDKLSIVPHLVCHDAIAGIYESLDRLHEWELQKLREDAAMSGKSDEALRTTVLCSRSGAPVMHERGRVGLSLDYWRERRLNHAQSTAPRNLTSSDLKTWGILIGCAPLGDMVFPPARVSNKWISDDVGKMQSIDEELLSMTTGPVLDWREPPNVVLPPAVDSKASVGMPDPTMSGLNFPEVVFMANFDPPVTLPYIVWEQLRQLTAAPPNNPDLAQLPTFDNLLFPIQPGTHRSYNASEPRWSVMSSRKVMCVGKDGDRLVKKHQNRLFIFKPVYGRTLAEMPFTHPRQLVAMLPTLRQYAFLSTLLRKSFDASKEEPVSPPESSYVSSTKTTKVTATTTTTDELAAFMGQAAKSEDSTTKGQYPLNVDVTLQALTSPGQAHAEAKLQVTFPFRDRTADILLEIKPNGVVHVETQNIILVDGMMSGDGMGSTKGKGREILPQDLGRALEIMENIGSWCEWIRSRLE